MRRSLDADLDPVVEAALTGWNYGGKNSAERFGRK